jgi:hypothetical protein
MSFNLLPDKRAMASVVVLLSAVCFSLHAQDFTIKKVELTGGNMVLHYDLVDSVRNRTYTINLYSSSDSYVNPLTKVSGDVGMEVKSGGNRKITWRLKEELPPDFNGDMALEVRGKVYIPFVKLDGFDDYKKFKRGKSYKITWTGGRGNSVLHMDLYKGDKKIDTYPNIANVGHHNLTFGKVKPGKNYRLKVSDSKNKDDVVNSGEFTIKRKTPIVLKLIGLAGVGYLVTLLLPEPVEPDINDPIKPKNPN